MSTNAASNVASKSGTTTLRLARFNDHAAMASVLAASFFEDVLFGRILHPHRKEYPKDCDLYWLRRIQKYWWDWSHVFVVTTAKSSSEGANSEREVITGVAHWSRIGDGARAVGYGLSKWDPRNIAYPMAKLYTALTSTIYPNRATDPAIENIVELSYPYAEHYWSSPGRSECWNLEHLAIHPDYQAQGIGRKLVQWGLNRADEEGVAASVVSAVTAEGFYQKCGFVGPVGWAGEGEGNPLNDVPGGGIFFKDAKGMNSSANVR